MATILPLRKSSSESEPPHGVAGGGPAHAPALHARAMDNLAYIRSTMEHAGTFTAVSGWGMVVVGVLALAAAVIAAMQDDQIVWLQVWLVAGVSSLVIQLWALVAKARSSGVAVLSGPGRKFVLAVSPPIFVGAVLTVALYRAGLPEIVPGMWLLLYGVAVVSGGAFSIEIVPVMGVCFIAAGVLALATPINWNDWILAVSFGGLHIAFGVPIARRHGG